MLKAISLALPLVLVACQCRAETLATLPNKNGGVIEFADMTCPYSPQMFYMVSRDPDGSYIEGCWRYSDNKLWADWPGVGKRVYSVGDVEFTPYAIRMFGSKPKRGQNM